MITGQNRSKQASKVVFKSSMWWILMRSVTNPPSRLVMEHHSPHWSAESFRLATKKGRGPVHLELPRRHRRRGMCGETVFPPMVTPPPRHKRPHCAKQPSYDRGGKSPLLLKNRSGCLYRKRVSGHEASSRPPAFRFFTTPKWAKRCCRRTPSPLPGISRLVPTTISCIAPLTRADLIINVGHDVVEKPPFYGT